jgi:hypothetical protein
MTSQQTYNTLPPSSDTVASVQSAGPFPEDVLRQIMELTMQDCIGSLDPNQPPLAFLKVCTTWKAIAESIPSLWSGISVTPSYFLWAKLPVIMEWLQRSRSTKLQVGIHVPQVVDLRLLNAVTNIFLPTSNRWECLSLSIPPHYLQRFLHNQNAPLPSLETLMLSLATQPVTGLAPTATRLRNVRLAVFPPMVTPYGDLLNLRWNQITCLEIVSMAGTIADIWNTFTRCPVLETLKVTAMNNPTTPFIPFYPHNLFCSTFLARLTLITNSRPGVIGYFLDGLYLPCLENLELHFTDRVYDTHIWPMAEILGLRARALPPLTMLSVRGKTIGEADLCDFVSRMKYLERLDVNDGINDLVTQAVRNLLPQDDTGIQRQREAHRQELILRGFTQN